MDQKQIQARVEQFLKEIGVPGFIVFGYADGTVAAPEGQTGQFHVVSSFKDMPTNAAIKSLSKVLSEFADKTL